jgi:hypothetical protein
METYGTSIVWLTGPAVRTSRNLRGMRDYARTSPVVCVLTRRDPENPVRGILHVVYRNGATSRASFASHPIMVDWVRNRRTWRHAEMRHLDGSMGYLTRPGVTAGQA